MIGAHPFAAPRHAVLAIPALGQVTRTGGVMTGGRDSSPLPPSAAVGDDGVGELAATAAARGVIRPGALHREGTSGQGQVGDPAAGPRGYPGALIGVLAATGVSPAAGWVLVGEGLGVLVALNDRDAVLGARAAGVDEVRTAGATHVSDIRAVGESDVPVGGGRPDAWVAVPVVPGAEPPGRGVEAIGVSPGRGDDDVLGVPVGRGGGVAEMGGRIDGLRAELEGSRLARRCGALVRPDTGQRITGGVGDMLGVAARAGLGAGRDAIAVLGHHAGPQVAVGPEALENLLEVGSLARGITRQGDIAVRVGALGAPLGAVEDQVHLLSAGGDADAVDAAAVPEVVGRQRRSRGVSR